MKKTIYFFAPLFLCLVFLLSAVTSTIQISESIADKVFRLHIIANSDEEDDQHIKLLIRDALLSASEGWYQDCQSVDDAVKASQQHLSEVTSIAETVLQQHHFSYSATAVVDTAFFDTREYDGFTLPSGSYQCLRIVLGKGEGHNWWCVMFPSVCLSACSDGFDGVLTEEEQSFINDNYTVKFKIVEIYEAYCKKKQSATGQ